MENLHRELLQKCAVIQENCDKIMPMFFTVQVWSKMITMNNNCLFQQNLAANTLMTAVYQLNSLF